MPLPKPKPGESQDAFMSRCMGDETMMSDFPDEDQRIAVCMNQSEKSMMPSYRLTEAEAAALVPFPPSRRGYSLLQIKSVDDDKRMIEGVATTPNPDRMGDVIVTEGVEFKLPLPLLYQHDAKNPIGSVTRAKVQKDGIEIQAKVAPAGIDADVDRAWSKIKNGLVRGLSIGFRSLEESFDKQLGGFRILRSEWLELSAVTIPANAEATITSVKAFDLEAQPHLGKGRGIVRLDAPSLPALVGHVRIDKSMTTQEQITQWDAKLVSTKEQIEQIMKAAETGARTLEADEETKIDELETEVEKITKHIDRLKRFEKTMVAKATVIDTQTVNTAAAAEAVRNPNPVITVKAVAPKGVGMARVAMAVMQGAMSYQNPMDIAKRRWPDNPEVALTIKAAIEAGDTTTSGWASQLVPSAQQLTNEFLELLRAATIIDRLPGLRRVPFNVSVPLETASGTVQWVGEGAPKPATKLTLSSVTLRWAKAAAIVGITEELARFSQPDAEVLVRDSMVKTLVRFFDSYFVGSAAEVTNVAPAGILNGISATTPTGTTAAAFRTDLNNLLNNFTANNVPLTSITLLMSSTLAVAFSLMVSDLGVALFPNITSSGGSILGFPVIISEAVGTKIIALNTDNIFLAEDPGVRVDVSREASIEMSDTPIQGDTSPFTSAVFKSAFQNNLIFIRVEQFKTWKAGRTSAVEYINNALYTV